MKLTIYQVDAFANKVFEGNPAAICPLQKWLEDDVMQNIAAENNLSETAFFVPTDSGYRIRWFTPVHEVDLCGHATLAAAQVIFQHIEKDKSELHFESKSGILSVSKNSAVSDAASNVTKNAQRLVMDFPSQAPSVCATPQLIVDAFKTTALACLQSQDYIVVFDSVESVQNANPDMSLLRQLNLRGVIITAQDTRAESELDFVSRFFAPKYGIDEDPVTGSSFTQLIPYWSEKLDKNVLSAKQVSRRGGEVACEYKGERVSISGKAVQYLVGEIEI